MLLQVELNIVQRLKLIFSLVKNNYDFVSGENKKMCIMHDFDKGTGI
jgi:hypothetical protein